MVKNLFYLLKVRPFNRNTHSFNCTVTAVTAAVTVPEVLHGPIHSPQTSQIQFLEEEITGQCVGPIP